MQIINSSENKLISEIEALKESFKEERGKHFDPELIDIFFNHLDEFLTIRNSINDIN